MLRKFSIEYRGIPLNIYDNDCVFIQLAKEYGNDPNFF